MKRLLLPALLFTTLTACTAAPADTLPAGAPHAEFVKATDAMNARLDALDLSEVEIEEIETPKE